LASANLDGRGATKVHAAVRAVGSPGAEASSVTARPGDPALPRLLWETGDGARELEPVKRVGNRAAVQTA
jgi:hypothetical protein